MRSNKFEPTKAWRKRQKLDNFIADCESAMGCVTRCRDGRLFEKDNMDFSVRELKLSSARLYKFYMKNK